MENKYQSYERLEKIIEWAGMSTHAFAMKIGMKRSENLYRIIRNKENLTIKLAMQILNTFPQINRNWLVYGDDEMIIPNNNIHKAETPYYMNYPLNEEAASYISLPMFDVDMAITVNDNAMSPQLRNGDILLLKKHNSDIILYGQMYYIVTNELSFVRRVRKSDFSELTLEPVDVSFYDSITIGRDKIVDLYLVVGVVSKLV